MATPDFTTEELESEEWRIIADFPDYAVSNLGRMKRVVLRRHPSHVGRILSYSPSGANLTYHSTHLRRDGKRYNVNVHRIVALAFLGEPVDDANEVDHLDSDPFNNRASNLEWVTHAENCRRTKGRGRLSTGVRHSLSIKIENRTRGDRNRHCSITEEAAREIKRLLRETRLPAHRIAEMTGTTAGIVYHIKRGDTWSWVE